MNDENKQQKFLSIKSASELSGLDKQTIRKFFDNKTIDGYKTPSARPFFYYLIILNILI
jgi:hypothetical protein